jgi:hypothetical protein
MTGDGALSRSLHDEFLELCAISTSGELSPEEGQRLRDHLSACSSCREAMQQYEAVVGETVPALAPDVDGEPDPSWSPDQAEAALFERLALEEQFGTDREGANGCLASNNLGKVPLSVSQAAWRNVWTLYAAGILLCVALGILAYQGAVRRVARSAALVPRSSQKDTAFLEKQASDAGHEGDVLRTQIAQREKQIASLRQEIAAQSAEIGRMKFADRQVEADLKKGQAAEAHLLEERSDWSQKLEAAETKTQGLQDQLDSLERQSSQDNLRAADLEAKVSDMNRLLRDHEATIDQQQELLAHDRDIRDLMGARDLYVAEVYDVERTGQTRKPYGRVFYTKGRSLIFYAYDLDQQAGVKNASTFQAWGRRGSDWQQALSLGVFYVDNASKRRWVLRFDDPKTLAQIDAVFVTVEPNGGSHKPSNKPLLFAYLHIDPNHP